MIKGLNTSFTLVSAGYEICPDRQRRPLFVEKNSHVTITWHAVVPCEHLYCRQVHAHHFSSRVWGTLVEEDEIWGQFLFEPRLHVECRVIVSYLKEQVLVYQNQLSNLFCRMGWTNSLNKAFSENSSLTNDIGSIILSDFLSHGNYIWSY